MTLWELLLMASALTSVACFIYIQQWMNDPRRREFNEEWYRQFEQYRMSRYNSEEMLESMRGFSEHFHNGGGAPG